jgi:hypothetical protein
MELIHEKKESEKSGATVPLMLYDAAGNQILPPHDAAGSQFGSWSHV